MTSRVLATMLAGGCMAAAAGGAYVAVRHNGPGAGQQTVSVPAAEQRVPAGVAEGAANAAASAPAPVSETEAVVEDARPAAVAPPAPVLPPAAAPQPAPGKGSRKPGPALSNARVERPASPVPSSPPPRSAAPAAAGPAPTAAGSGQVQAAERPQAAAPPAAPVDAEPVRPAERPAPRAPEFEEIVVPASSVLGLRVDTPLSSERARIEDRVDARLTRDVTVDGRVAIPSGTRVLGSVTVVERGGKVHERARLGVRFHTLVLANGREVPLRTEAIMREGDSPGNESARKIGGAAIGGAILGAIMGGGKGAMMGGAAGAAGGSAAVMAGERNAATLPAGTVVSVRLSAPATLEVERPLP